jgi:hypothetical protein
LAPYKSRNRNAFPNTCRSERVRAIERFDLVSAGRFNQEQAADHLLAIIRDQRAGYHNLDAKARGVAEEGLMCIVVGEPSR